MISMNPFYCVMREKSTAVCLVRTKMENGTRAGMKGEKDETDLLFEVRHMPQGKKMAGGAADSFSGERYQRGKSHSEELREWIRASGIPAKKFFNTSGLKYKELKLKDRMPEMTEEEQIALLASDGMLVKRPVLLTDEKDGRPGRVLVGFQEAQWEELL